MKKERRISCDLNILWESAVMFISGFMLLRLSGRISITQMTIPTTVVVISIRNIIVQPIIEDSKLNTVMAIAVFMVVLIDVKVALLEPNGRIGIELTDDAKPLTVGEFKQMLGIQNKKEDVHYGELFAEVMDKKHSNVPPTKLD